MLPEGIRDIHILQGIVELFVRDGVPVSSRTLKQLPGHGGKHCHHPQRDGPPRARRLPDEAAHLCGPVCRPTRAIALTSIGSSPTVPSTTNCPTRVREEISVQADDFGAIISAASRVLGGLTKNLAVAYGSFVQESRVRRVQLVSLEGTRLLAVVTLGPRVRTDDGAAIAGCVRRKRCEPCRRTH